MAVEPTSSSLDSILQRSIQIQGQSLLKLIEVLKQAEITQAKPLRSLSDVAKVDLNV
ncbi:MAG: hypothetical protein AB1546_13690 [bacterium]